MFSCLYIQHQSFSINCNIPVECTYFVLETRHITKPRSFLSGDNTNKKSTVGPHQSFNNIYSYEQSNEHTKYMLYLQFHIL